MTISLVYAKPVLVLDLDRLAVVNMRGRPQGASDDNFKMPELPASNCSQQQLTVLRVDPFTRACAIINANKDSFVRFNRLLESVNPAFTPAESSGGYNFCDYFWKPNIVKADLLNLKAMEA